MRVFVTGASGFVGRHLVSRLLDAGYQVRALVRDLSRARGLPADRVDLVEGDVTDPASLAGKLVGVDVLAHLVGIIREHGEVTFERTVVGGTRNVLDEALRAKVGHIYYQSALGTRPNARSRYHQTKWVAEEMVRDCGIPSSILRPSTMIGEGDGFTPILVGLVRDAPFIPIAGTGKPKMQPIALTDMISCILWALKRPEGLAEAIDLGGPDQIAFERLVEMTALAAGVRKPKIHIPIGLMKASARRLEGFRFFPVSYDQLLMLEEDNICDPDVLLRVFGIRGTHVMELLPQLVREILAKH